MYFGDHAPPHFHVITRSDERAAYLIETLELQVGEIDPRDVTEALEWAWANRDELRARWREYSEEDR